MTRLARFLRRTRPVWPVTPALDADPFPSSSDWWTLADYMAYSTEALHWMLRNPTACLNARWRNGRVRRHFRCACWPCSVRKGLCRPPTGYFRTERRRATPPRTHLEVLLDLQRPRA